MTGARIPSQTLELLWADLDDREATLRRVISDVLAEDHPPAVDGAVTATYFLALRSQSLTDFAEEIAYHATSGTRHPPSGSLLAECTGFAAGVVPFDTSGRIGLLHMAFPLKMLSQPDGHLTSTDILHTAAGAIIFDVFESQDARLVALNLPPDVVQGFPGPSLGALGFRSAVGLQPGQAAFGTILKPTAGLVPTDERRLVGEIASIDLFSFVKEDENLYPSLPYCPLAERTHVALEEIERRRPGRADTLLFAPHVTAAPGELLANVDTARQSGARAVMFSESWALGGVRMVREHLAASDVPIAIYGHNAGIGVRTRAIWREVLDLLARLDGIDFRQTAPVLPGPPFLRPSGLEWRASEQILTEPMDGIRPTTIVRAGGLDQGNIGLNLRDAEDRGILDHVLFLAGSAINSIKDGSGRPDPHLGASAMIEAIDVHRSGVLAEVAPGDHPRALLAVARDRRLGALASALEQRYPGLG